MAQNGLLFNELALFGVGFFYPALSHWASLLGSLIILMICKLSALIRPACASVWLGCVIVINNSLVTGFHWMGLPALSAQGTRALRCITSPSALISTSS